MHTLSHPIVVGVDASTCAASDTLAWACTEAELRGLPLWIFVGPGEQQTLDGLVTKVRHRHPGLDIVGLMAPTEDWSQAVLSAAPVADSLVLGGQSGAGSDRERRLAAAVVDRSESPVVVCNAGYASGAAREEVIVGLAHDCNPHSTMAYGFAHARGHAIGVRVVYQLAPGIPLHDAPTQERLVDLLSIWAQMYPDVPIDAELINGDLTEALVEKTSQAQLLVVGHRRNAAASPLQLTTKLLQGDHAPTAFVPLSASRA